MRNYKIVCSDLDGTLFNNEGKISCENMQAIDELTSRGIYFVPSTGRTFSELPEEIKNNPSIRYIIYSNGAVVLDKQTNKSHLTGMSNQTVRRIMDILSEFEVHLTIRQGGNCFVDATQMDIATCGYYNVLEAHRVVMGDIAVLLDDFNDFCLSVDDVEDVSVFFHSEEERLACKERLNKMGGLRIVSACEYNLEIMSARAGKGNALHRLADMLGVSYSDTISMGDSDNDSSIIEAAGLGLAVSNACRELKTIADETICSNEEHAVSYVLSRYF